MRLLNVSTLKLELFMGPERSIPPYAILSHTWGDSEIVFDDIQSLSTAALKENPGFDKVFQTCLQAQRDHFDYVWIDTCCIDKSSSAELSEAINSMFKYYAQSSTCYVYLNDFNVPCLLGPGDDVFLGAKDTSFFHSRWFERGWTLQELIAPHKVEFFDQYWRRFGTRDGELLDRVCRRTGIWPQVFSTPRCKCQNLASLTMVREEVCPHCRTRDTLYHTLDTFAVSIKMSWAATRVTTRPEDAAYCLLGLFGINMPLLYGEGRKAFLRLQDLIIRQSKDQSVLLWEAFRTDAPLSTALGCLAPAAGYFKNPVPIIGRRVFVSVDRQFEADFMGRLAPMELTDTALITNLWICPCTVRGFDTESNSSIDREFFLGVLDLAYDDDFLKRPAILLEHMGVMNIYRRVYNQLIISVDPRMINSSFQISLEDGHPGVHTLVDNNTLTVTRDLSRAFKEDVKILLEQSPMNLVKAQSSTEKTPPSGPIYLIMQPHEDIHFVSDSGGTHPLLSSYESKAAQLAAPWTFEKCNQFDTDRFIGGLHFFDLDLSAKRKEKNAIPFFVAPKIEVAIIWGMHAEVEIPAEGRKLARSPDDIIWKPWCRVFDMRLFMRHARTSTDDLLPNQLYRRDSALAPGEIQKRIEAQRRRLCLGSYSSQWMHVKDGPRKLFPDSTDDDWTEDVLPAAFEDENIIVDLITKVNCVEGLGRTVYELEMRLEWGDKDDWRPDLSEAQCIERREQEWDAVVKQFKKEERKIYDNYERWRAEGFGEISRLSRERMRQEGEIYEKWRVRIRNLRT